MQKNYTERKLEKKKERKKYKKCLEIGWAGPYSGPSVRPCTSFISLSPPLSLLPPPPPPPLLSRFVCLHRRRRQLRAEVSGWTSLAGAAGGNLPRALPCHQVTRFLSSWFFPCLSRLAAGTDKRELSEQPLVTA